MTILFTQEELIQYLYNETSPEKNKAIEAALQADWKLSEKLENLKLAALQLNEEKLYSPREKTIASILDYAKKTTEVALNH
jgi:hypothetical protein